jgi:DNA polymerase
MMQKKELDQGEIKYLVKGLIGYLGYLKSCGVEEAPMRQLPDFSRQRKAEPVPSVQPLPAVAPLRPPEKPSPEKFEPEAPEELFSVDKTMTLEKIREEIGDCKRCKLHEGRSNIVFGMGNPKADLVFVGDGPGEDEDLRGEPAGQLLTKIIEKAMNLKREEVFICNVVKCRPPGNREPERDEINICSPFLFKQLRAIKPKLIVALGRPAASALLNRSVLITKERGTWGEFEGAKVMLTYPPSFVQERYTEEVRRQVYNDMLQVMAELKKIKIKNER